MSNMEQTNLSLDLRGTYIRIWFTKFYFTWLDRFLSKDEVLKNSSTNLSINYVNEVRHDEDSDFAPMNKRSLNYTTESDTKENLFWFSKKALFFFY